MLNELYKSYKLVRMYRQNDKNHWHWNIYIKLSNNDVMTIGSRTGKVSFLKIKDISVSIKTSTFDEIPNRFALMAILGDHDGAWVSYVMF